MVVIVIQEGGPPPIIKSIQTGYQIINVDDVHVDVFFTTPYSTIIYKCNKYLARVIIHAM